MCSLQQINHVPINLYLIFGSIYWVYFVLFIRVFSVVNYLDLDSPLLLKYIVFFCNSNCGFCVFRCCVALVVGFFFPLVLFLGVVLLRRVLLWFMLFAKIHTHVKVDSYVFLDF
jgi:hypothetical protein